ncbi:hypothetical protein RAA17_25325 [Komagataeibacter rhaeticus]|nr:hypothetical protein [Komagataeibacter rhaeticus]
MHIGIGGLTGRSQAAIMFGEGLCRDDGKPLRDGSSRLPDGRRGAASAVLGQAPTGWSGRNQARKLGTPSSISRPTASSNPDGISATWS